MEMIGHSSQSVYKTRGDWNTVVENDLVSRSIQKQILLYCRARLLLGRVCSVAVRRVCKSLAKYKIR